MKVAFGILLFALACLVTSSVVWMRAADAPVSGGAEADPNATLAAFTEQHPAHSDVRIDRLYAGRLELVDPRLALPTWHKHAREEATRLHAAIAHCPPAPVELSEPALAKARAWHARTCDDLPDDLPELDAPPFMHPSGKSYAALALMKGQRGISWIRAHAGSFHVLELGALAPEALSDEQHVLARLTEHGWQAMLRGDALVLDAGFLVIAERSRFGLTTVHLYDEQEFASFARRAGIALSTRTASGACLQPASPELCWAHLSPMDRHRFSLALATSLSAGVTVLAAVAVVVAYVRQRRRMQRDRVHVLRVLTHELRSPAMTVALDIEPLRAAYDELPGAVQEPFLRVSDGVERMKRVLHRSARYMALFETPSAGGIVRSEPQASARAMLDSFTDEWPEGVSLNATSSDGAVRTDPEWLAVAVRNLVENASKHGKPPVAVTWSLDERQLVIRVTDAGETRRLSLRDAVVPFDRAKQSTGLGLGLAIVDRIANLLGGRLVHEAAPTSFELRVPRGGRS